ncbi:hypothetical protein PNEG_01997 [Pneumocystis murina B123]|uniref:Anoctamin dimerisation domain-containing protein n=1 Tax=Pneumocystis murina (strain B123) TaxID=1069680 RepID=M7NRU5_PNEMU|nr:hypothetical protein PNEG_01997 [Pneumocystis murina B123]EMR09816.1 hypothetical protein PNEG_01997 [Pneumocystis murina B123]
MDKIKISQLSDKNIPVDYVICFYYDKTLKKTVEQFKKLVQRLSEVGLNVECYNDSLNSIFLFISCSSSRLHLEASISRRKDWLYGIEKVSPYIKDDEKITVSERLRLVYDIISSPVSEGGAGICPDLNEWKMVKFIFPLHDYRFNKDYMDRILKKWVINESDLDILKNHFGEKIALYFFFIQFYILWLIFPTIFGLFIHFFFPKYSIVFAITITLWSIIFIQMWKKTEVKLSVRWGVYGISKIYQRRGSFIEDKTGKDVITRQTIFFFSILKWLFRKIVSFLFQMVFSIVIICILVGIFFVELYFLEIYDGPFQKYLVIVPTVLFMIFISIFSVIYNILSTYINYYENHETDIDFESSSIRKAFLVNFIISYTSLFMISCFYVPFGSDIIPKINILNIQSIFTDSQNIRIKLFTVNSDKLKKQFIYYMITARAINFFKQWTFPFLSRFFFSILRRIYTTKFLKIGHEDTNSSSKEFEFLRKIRAQMELPEFSVFDNYLELIIQFGYILLFSIIWPLGSLCSLLSNIIKIISDYIKLLLATKRSIPFRTDTIGFWSSYLTLLSWLGTIVMTILIYFHNYSLNTYIFSEFIVLGIFSNYLYIILYTIFKKIFGYIFHEEKYILRKYYSLKNDHLKRSMDQDTAKYREHQYIKYDYTNVIETGTSIITDFFKKYKKE